MERASTYLLFFISVLDLEYSRHNAKEIQQICCISFAMIRGKIMSFLSVFIISRIKNVEQ